MPVIGYQRQYYKGICWKRIVPEKRWLFVDTTWGYDSRGNFYNNKSWVRFDIRSNYWYLGSLTKIRVY